MDIYKDLSGNYPDCIVTYFHFENYASSIGHDDKALFVGYNTQMRSDEIESIKEGYKNVIFFNQEMPCAYTLPDKNLHNIASDLNNVFTNIYTICPLTGDWINKNYNDGKKKYKPILFPIDEKMLLDKEEKEYDSIFYGSVCGKDHEEYINIISKFNYNFITLGIDHWNPNDQTVDKTSLGKLITHQNIHTFQKWKILNKTRAIPIYNQLYLHDNHVENIKTNKNWKQNAAWSHIDQNICPQLKPRCTEAAFFRMLMVVKKDPWNLIEYWFEPGKDFIYFDKNEELEDILEDVNKNYEKYEPIVENAFNKAVNNYTTEKLLKRMAEGVE